MLTQLSTITPQFGGISKLPNGQIQLNGTGLAGVGYTIQANGDLATTNWTNIGSAAANQNGSISFVDTNAAAYSKRFYRLKAP